MADSDERWTLMLLLLLLMSLLLNMISSLCLRSISEQRCEVRGGGGQKTVVVVEDCHGSDQQRQKHCVDFKILPVNFMSIYIGHIVMMSNT